MRSRQILAAAILLVLSVLPAKAVVLFVGGEDVSFLCHNLCAVSTVPANYRGAWAREAYGPIGTPFLGAAWPSGAYFTTPTFANQGDIWIHAQAKLGLPTNNNFPFLWVYGSDGTPAVMLQGTGTNGQVKISSIDEAGSITDLFTCPSNTFPSTNLDQLDVHVVYAIAGSVTIYQNSVQTCIFSGDVTTNGRTLLNQAAFANIAIGTPFWSEIAITDFDTRAENVRTFVPNASGNAVLWNGANPCTNILNNTAWNDAVFVSTETSNILEQCAIDGSVVPGAYTLDAVAMATRALIGTTGPQLFQYVTRTGGADFFSGNFTPTYTMGNIVPYIQETNPQTAAPWNPTDPAQPGFNIGLKSIP
jgi:hypothetical protein